MNGIKTAIIGAGFMGPAHTEALRRLGVTVEGILGVDAKESTTAAGRLGIPKAYNSLDEVLADKDVSVVHITTPNQFHYAIAKAALNAGKHVLCEKPLAMNSAESSELVEIAKKTGLAAGVNYSIRFYPLNIDARDRVARGDIGEVFSVMGSYVQDWLMFDTDYNWRVVGDQGGKLRAIADVGTHWLDLVKTITGLKVESIFADLKTVHPIRKRPLGEVETYKSKMETAAETEPVNIDTEDAGAVLFRFKGGARGCLWVSQVTAGRKNCLRYEIAGSKGSMAWNSETPNSLWLGSRTAPNQELLKDPSLLSDTARSYASFPGGHNEGFPDSFKQCFKSFYSYIAAGDFSAKPYFPTFADGHEEVVFCDAVLKSNAEQKWVTV